MKKSELTQIIKEEIRKVLSEAVVIDPILKNKLKTAIANRLRDGEDKDAFLDVVKALKQIYKKAGRADAGMLAVFSMQDSRMNTITGALNVIKDMLKSKNTLIDQ